MSDPDPGTDLDIQFIRQEHAKGNAHAVLERTTEVRARLDTHHPRFAEATMHHAWALGALHRNDETQRTYDELFALVPAAAEVIYVTARCDYALWLHRLGGKADEVQSVMSEVCNLAAASLDSQLIHICAATAAEIVTSGGI